MVRHGGTLPSPPPEVDASGCSGPTVFVNVLPSGDRQIWLWNADNRKWDAVRLKHVVDLDVKRKLSLNSKHVPIFTRVESEKGDGSDSRFVQYVSPQPSQPSQS